MAGCATSAAGKALQRTIARLRREPGGAVGAAEAVTIQLKRPANKLPFRLASSLLGAASSLQLASRCSSLEHSSATGVLLLVSNHSSNTRAARSTVRANFHFSRLVFTMRVKFASTVAGTRAEVWGAHAAPVATQLHVLNRASHRLCGALPEHKQGAARGVLPGRRKGGTASHVDSSCVAPLSEAAPTALTRCAVGPGRQRVEEGVGWTDGCGHKVRCSLK